MKTHINNTKAIDLYNDVMGKTMFSKHQENMHSGNIKPAVVTRRKEQVKIVNNNKKQINQNPKQHVNHLFKNLAKNQYKSTIDNKPPKNYASGKKILQDRLKKNPQENYVKAEHQRELRSQADRLKSCKSITQRKKDKTDPIVNPTYFMRDGEHVNEVTIDQYRNTVLKKNRPVSGINPQTKTYGNTGFYMNIGGSTSQDYHGDEPMQRLGNIPNYSHHSKHRPHSAKNPQAPKGQREINMSSEDLPECTFKAILNHIVEKKMFRDTDIKVLYVRLCHRYGEDNVDQIWEYLMEELQN